MEAAVNTELDAKRKEEQAQLEKLQNERCFIGHPFGIGIVSFKFFMTSLTSYGMSAILIYYFYAAAPEGLGLTKIHSALSSASSVPTCRTASSVTEKHIALLTLPDRSCTSCLRFRASA